MADVGESIADQRRGAVEQGWLPDVLSKAAATYGSRLKLYQVDSEGKVLMGSPSGPLAEAIKAQGTRSFRPTRQRRSLRRS